MSASGLPEGSWPRTVVAVDGPAGSGKSSVSRAAAKALGFDFLDTGAAYRSLAWLALERGIDLDSADAVRELLGDFDYEATLDPAHPVFQVGGVVVSEAIREPRVSAVVSAVARVPAVRLALNERFRELLAYGEAPGVIAEGRDITTVVAPDAPVRVLLTASPEVRAARRAAELTGAEAAAAGERIAARDAADSKVVEFMEAAPGVTTLDSSALSFEETVAALVELVRG